MRRFILYERSYCHLCDEMRAALEPWRARGEIAVLRVDVDDHPEHEERYGLLVPVLVDEQGAEICHYVLDGEALQRTLRAKRGAAGRYERIYAVVSCIPPGRVASYGQVAAIEGHSGPRNVGYALAALPAGRDDVPWQRVVNAAGALSERSGGGGTASQRDLLAAEGVAFDARGRIDFDVYGWDGPDWAWIERHGAQPAPRPPGRSGRRTA